MIDQLYEKVGGAKVITKAVDVFYDKVLADETLRPFFDHTDMKHLRTRQSMFLSMLVGGEMVYTGRDMRTAHAQPRRQGMTPAHFDALLRHFREALIETGVAPENADELVRRLEGTRKDVLSK